MTDNKSKATTSALEHLNGDDENVLSLDELADAEDDDYDVPPSEDEDPTYLPGDERVASTSLTPLKNNPRGSGSMSSASVKKLEDKGHRVKTCMLTRTTNALGDEVERSHMIDRATYGNKVRLSNLVIVTRSSKAI